jgi:Family of unknown function (DUF5670)
VFTRRQTADYYLSKVASGLLLHTKRHHQFGGTSSQGAEDMLGIVAAVLIAVWLLGYFAFHVTGGFIHIALIVGLVLLVLYFMKLKTAIV